MEHIKGDKGDKGELQWGHGLSAVEMTHSAQQKPNPLTRFNGATAFQPWKSGTPIKRIEIPKPLASMGPRPFSRGNTPSKPPPLPHPFRLQWGHGLSAVEISVATRPAKPAPGGLQWGHGLSAVEISDAAKHPWPTIGFNGATAFQPWKCRPIRPASPWRFGFNGATAFQPWKCSPASRGSSKAFTLQWGHGLSAVEMIAAAGTAQYAIRLQWGHGLSAVEMRWFRE